jgi:A/G-specific adenine glycosylase
MLYFLVEPEPVNFGIDSDISRKLMNTTPKKVKYQNDTDKTPHSNEKVKHLSINLLSWYDKNKRVLPWRAEEDTMPNPYFVWLSEIMLQQTQVKTVIPYFLKFVEKWPTVKSLADAEQNEVIEAWAGLGYYNRARNLHKCAKIIVEKFNSKFPDNITDLKALPGIGDYTSAAILSIAFNKPATVIDGNIERIISRLYSLEKPIKNNKKEIKSKGDLIFKPPLKRPGDLAQALMDLGSNICITGKPLCERCPISNICEAFTNDKQEIIPLKADKKEKPKKHGYIYYIKNPNNEILLQRRPEEGMLAGTLGLPTTDWVGIDQNICHLPIFDAYSKSLGISKKHTIFHSFTHFDLKLTGVIIDLDPNFLIKVDDDTFFWQALNKTNPDNFPSVFKKFITFFI